MKFRNTLVALGAMALAGGAVVVAGNHDEHGHDHADQDMAAWMEMNGPNENHERLHFLIGEWDADMRYAMGKDMPAEPGTFTATFKSVMDGRFVEEHVVSPTPMGEFKGRGVMGYDNHAEEYVSIWFDNAGTTIHMSKGEWDASEKTFTFHSKSPDLMTGEVKKVRSEMKRISEDRFSVKEWVYEKDGSHWQRFEAEYKRK